MLRKAKELRFGKNRYRVGKAQVATILPPVHYRMKKVKRES
jgi:hypothetical protein